MVDYSYSIILYNSQICKISKMEQVRISKIQYKKTFRMLHSICYVYIRLENLQINTINGSAIYTHALKI